MGFAGKDTWLILFQPNELLESDFIKISNLDKKSLQESAYKAFPGEEEYQAMDCILAPYIFPDERRTFESIITEAKNAEIYGGYGLQAINFLCYKHIVEGRNILDETEEGNCFFVHDKNQDPWWVWVFLHLEGWQINLGRVSEFEKNDALKPVKFWFRSKQI